MKLGVHIGYWGLGLTSQDQVEIVQEAERLGYDSVWTAEAYGSDAATILGWLAGQTTRIKLGSGIFQMPVGQSGHPLSPYYRNGHAAWEEGRPTPFLPGRTVHRLALTP